jgi:hypothetical protein
LVDPVDKICIEGLRLYFVPVYETISCILYWFSKQGMDYTLSWSHGDYKPTCLSSRCFCQVEGYSVFYERNCWIIWSLTMAPPSVLLFGEKPILLERSFLAPSS